MYFCLDAILLKHSILSSAVSFDIIQGDGLAFLLCYSGLVTGTCIPFPYITLHLYFIAHNLIEYMYVLFYKMFCQSQKGLKFHSIINSSLGLVRLQTLWFMICLNHTEENTCTERS